MTRAKNQNIVRSSNYEEDNDNFPTPPWATRAFFEYVAPSIKAPTTVIDPCCGAGHMVKVFKEKKFKVLAYDNIDYGTGHKLADYASKSTYYPSYDYMITNPPYKLANEFALRAMEEAKLGVGLLLRTIWMESVKRHDQLFKPRPPTTVAVFSRRMPAAKGKLVRKGSAMMSHSWYWWDLTKKPSTTRLIWLPPDAQYTLELDSDYDS